MRSSNWFRSVLLAVLTAGSLAACGGAASSSAKPAEPTAAASDPSCPVEVPGTSVAVEDTATGAALVFVTTGDVAELRRRVEAMAAMHNEHHGKMGPLPTGEGPAAGHAGHDMGGMDHSQHDMKGMDHAGGKHAGHAGGMITIHAKASKEDVDGGARLVLVVAPADVAALGDQLRMHVQHMAAGTCTMKGH